MLDFPSPREEEVCSASPHSAIGGEQGVRLLEQMRTCVLVHHQLSCLLIHSAALQAGLYGESDSLDECLGEVVSSERCQGLPALKNSIQSLGSSTARLFCMALRDRKDLQSMGDTLSCRVDEMVVGLQKELTEDGVLLAECTQLEAQLDTCRREAQRLRAKQLQQRQQRQSAERRRVFEEAKRVKTLEERRQALKSCLDALLAAGLTAEAAEGAEAKAAMALVGSTPASRHRGTRGQSHSLQRQLHENQLERRRVASPEVRVMQTPIRVAAGPPSYRQVSAPVIRGRHLAPTAPQPPRRHAPHVPAAGPAEAATLAQLEAQLRASQTDFWGM